MQITSNVFCSESKQQINENRTKETEAFIRKY